MLKAAKFLVPVATVFVAIAVSQAEKSNDAKTVAATDCQKCEATCSDCASCPLTKAMEALPKLVYKIGDETTTSPVQAGRISRKTKHKVEFAVLDKVFQNETEAFAALVDMTEKHVADFAKPKKCETSGKTFVAGKSLCCDVAANEVTTLVKKAMDTVKVTYMVGKTSVCCPDEAKLLAKKSGDKVIQCIAGQKCGGCGTTNRLTLARAKYKAAIEALLAAEKKAQGNDKSVTEQDVKSKETSVS